MRPLTKDIPGIKSFGVGMVGGGKGAFFAEIHRAAMRMSNRFHIVAGAFSSDPIVCREAGAAFQLETDRTYTSFAAMVAAEAARPDAIDVAVVVTPNHLHFEPCLRLLEANIPVICDKPLVNDAHEAYALIRAAKPKDTFFAMTYTYLGYPMVRDARARIRDGELGEIRFMYVEYLLEWLAYDPSQLGKGGIWRGDPTKAGPTGALGDVGTHAFNLLEFLCGRRCIRVNAKLTTTVPGFALDDTDVVQMEFDGGVDGLLWASLAAPGHRNGLRVKIVGSQASLEWRQEAPDTLLVSRMGKADLVYRRGHSDMTADGRRSVSLPAGNSEGYIEALAVLYSDFGLALEAGQRWRSATPFPIPDLHEGLRGVMLSKVCIESSAGRCWVDFPNTYYEP